MPDNKIIHQRKRISKIANYYLELYFFIESNIEVRESI